MTDKVKQRRKALAKELGISYQHVVNLTRARDLGGQGMTLMEVRAWVAAGCKSDDLPISKEKRAAADAELEGLKKFAEPKE